MKLHHSSFKVNTASWFAGDLVWYKFVFLSLCFHQAAIASRSKPLEAFSISHVTLIISTLKWLKVEPRSSLLRKQILLQSMYIVHGPCLLRKRENIPDPVIDMIWVIFFMFGEWNSGVCPKCGTLCLVLELGQDVVNTALILMRKHLPFSLWASHTDSLFPGLARSVLLLIYGLFLVSTAATFVADSFRIKFCNFPGLRFCFH